MKPHTTQRCNSSLAIAQARYLPVLQGESEGSGLCACGCSLSPGLSSLLVLLRVQVQLWPQSGLKPQNSNSFVSSSKASQCCLMAAAEHSFSCWRFAFLCLKSGCRTWYGPCAGAQPEKREHCWQSSSVLAPAIPDYWSCLAQRHFWMECKFAIAEKGAANHRPWQLRSLDFFAFLPLLSNRFLSLYLYYVKLCSFLQGQGRLSLSNQPNAGKLLRAWKDQSWPPVCCKLALQDH